MLQVITPKRGTDGYGSGEFGAPRSGEHPTHRGIDYACYPGSLLLSPVKGRVTKLGWPYKHVEFFRYVEITDGHLLRHRFMYVEPVVEVGELIEVGQVIATAQPISDHHSKVKTLTIDTVPWITSAAINKIKNPMIGHVHYEIIDEHGNYLDPENLPESLQ